MYRNYSLALMANKETVIQLLLYDLGKEKDILWILNVLCCWDIDIFSGDQ